MKSSSHKSFKSIINLVLRYKFLIAADILLILGMSVFLVSRPVNNYTLTIPDIAAAAEDPQDPGSKYIPAYAENIISPGSYTFRVGYDSLGGNVISLTSDEKQNAVKCDEMCLNHLPDELPGVYNMDYKDGYLPGYSNTQVYITRNISDPIIHIHNYSGNQLNISSLELIGNRNYVRPILLTFILLVVLISIVLVYVRCLFENNSSKKSKLNNNEKIINLNAKENAEQSNHEMVLNSKASINDALIRARKSLLTLAFIAVTVLLTSIPVLSGKGIMFDDIGFTYARIEGIKDGLIDGQFPVRIHPNSLRNFGYAVPYFYPDLFMYPFAIMRLLGFSLRAAVNTMIVCINLATVCVSLYSLRSVYKNDLASFLGSFVYTLSLYRLTDVYARGAMAEAIAFIFLPLIVAGVYRILVQNRSTVPLVLGVVGIASSHLLTCEMAALFLVLMCIPCFRLVFRKEAICKLIHAATVSVLLMLAFLGPFVHMCLSDTLKVFVANAYTTSANTLLPENLFALTAVGATSQAPEKWMYSRYTLGIVVMALTLVGYVVTIIIRFTQNKPSEPNFANQSENTNNYSDKQRHNKNSKSNQDNHIFLFTTLCLVLGIIACIMTTDIFPWDRIEAIGGIVRTVVCMVQFPWRYLVIVSVMFSFALSGELIIILHYCARKDTKTSEFTQEDKTENKINIESTMVLCQ